ncbi:MAG: hypothetical protein ACKOC5_15205 [Chloroflexota bacterium]
MSTISDYSTEDWALLKETLAKTPLLVMAVSPQGLFGLVREGAALTRSLAYVMQAGLGHPLIDALWRELQTPASPAGEPADGPAGPDPASSEPEQPTPQQKDLDTLRRETLARCRRASQALAARAAPEEAEYYRQAVLWVCWQTAQAAREDGGWFGIGAVQVTGDEKEALRQVAFALGLPAAAAQQPALPAAPRLPVPPGLAELLAAEEWEQLRQAPLWVSFAVMLAHPSGPFGLSRELSALPRLLDEARQRYPGNRLVHALTDDSRRQLFSGINELMQALPEPPQGQTTEAHLADFALQRLELAVEVLDRRLEFSEAIEFKRVLLDLARGTAEATKEGGFLGLGGSSVSEREQAVLARIETSLRL